MEGVRMSSMNKVNESDWRLFRSRLPIWQEAYMERRNREYIALLSGGGSASEKFWELEKRVREDKKSGGVVMRMSRANMELNILSLLSDGVISMARADYTSYSSQLTTESYNSAGSQFFINTASNTSLDGSYATFGKVIEGLDVVHAIENVEVKASSKSTNSDSDSGSNTEVSTPVNDVIISNVTVETYGVDYGKPKTLDVWDYYDWVYKTYGINLKSYNSGN